MSESVTVGAIRVGERVFGVVFWTNPLKSLVARRELDENVEVLIEFVAAALARIDALNDLTGRAAAGARGAGGRR